VISIERKNINVTYNSPVFPSLNNNITICQINSNNVNITYNVPFNNNVTICRRDNNQDVLRQSFPADSQYCQLSDDRKTLNIQVLTSTFNIPNENYYVIIGDNALIQASNGQPLMGIRENTWRITTGNIIVVNILKSLKSLLY